MEGGFVVFVFVIVVIIVSFYIFYSILFVYIIDGFFWIMWLGSSFLSVIFRDFVVKGIFNFFVIFEMFFINASISSSKIYVISNFVNELWFKSRKYLIGFFLVYVSIILFF